MSSLARSTVALLSLVALVLLAFMHMLQLDNIESLVLANGRAIDQLAKTGVSIGSGSAQTVRTTSSQGLRTVFSDREAAALADPENLLKAHKRPLRNTEDFVRGGTLDYLEGSDPRGLNQFIASGADPARYARWMNNRLGMRHVDNYDVWGPELAIKVTTPDDGLTYYITLRKGVLWNPPVVDWETGRYEWLRGEHELTSDDYVFLFEAFDNTQVAGRISSLRTYFEKLERVEAVDRYTIKFVFSERLFTNLVNLLDMEPLPRWLYKYDEDGVEFDEATWGLKLNEHWYNQKGIGVGPYRFVLWEPGVRLEFEANPNFWGEPPAFDRIVAHIVKDQAAWPRRVKTGDLDLSHIQPEQYRTEILEAKGPLLGNKHIKTITHPTATYFYFGWNADTPYFQDKRVRQAMTMALDRVGLIENVFHNLGRLHTGPYAQQATCYDDSIKPWPYDLDRAAANLEAAGWIDSDGDGIREKRIDGEIIPFEFTMVIYGSSSEYATIANIYREDLLSIGVKLNPVAVEWSTMLKKMDDREFDVYSGAWVTSWEIDLYQLWHSSEADRQKSSNRIGFRNAEADEIIVQLRKTFDPIERQKLCYAFHALVHEEQPYTFFYQRDRAVVYWDHLNAPEFQLINPYRDLRMWSFLTAEKPG
jgi:ABC-type transport system substrate-binding protein